MIASSASMPCCRCYSCKVHRTPPILLSSGVASSDGIVDELRSYSVPGDGELNVGNGDPVTYRNSSGLYFDKACSLSRELIEKLLDAAGLELPAIQGRNVSVMIYVPLNEKDSLPAKQDELSCLPGKVSEIFSFTGPTYFIESRNAPEVALRTGETSLLQVHTCIY